MLRKLTEPLSVEPDCAERSMIHHHILMENHWLMNIHKRWYKMIANYLPNAGKKRFLELGSGSRAGLFINNLITSDLLPGLPVDMMIDGCSLPFGDESLDGIVMVNVFHHFPDAEKFLDEAERVLCKGGRVVMSEPWLTPFSTIIYQKFHHEDFIPESAWSLPLNGGPLSRGNGALPWIVFHRDLLLFRKKYPSLRLIAIKKHTPFSYLFSGGLTYAPLINKRLNWATMIIDRLFAPLGFAMFACIVIEKK